MKSFRQFLVTLTEDTHPCVDERGRPVRITNPTKPSPKEDWHKTDTARVFPVGGEMPAHINGQAFTENHDPKLHTHPPLDDLAPPDGHKKIAAGVIMMEPDKSVWVTEPTNHFGGYTRTFPKGTHETGSLQETAVRETHEETGLHAQLTGVLGDFERTTSRCRYYVGKRIGGHPKAMGWETQAMHLVPLHQLEGYMNTETDKGIARALKAHVEKHGL